MRNTDPLMRAKFKSKTHLQNTFFDLLSRFLRVWLQSFQKVFIWPKFFFISKKISKNAEFRADVWRTWVKMKKGYISVTFLLITFFGSFFQNFNGLEISVKFCVCWYKYWIFNKNIFLLLLALFVNLDSPIRRKRLKKTDFFLNLS